MHGGVYVTVQAAAAPRAKPVGVSKAKALLTRCFGKAKTAAAACLVSGSVI